MNKKKITLILTLTLLTTFFTSCYSPNPLYGKWADNFGNTITFFTDLNFSAKIYNFYNIQEDFEGAYNVIENVMSFTKSDGSTTLTEWDIRGSILYITWTTGDGETLNLSLYRVSK